MRTASRVDSPVGLVNLQLQVTGVKHTDAGVARRLCRGQIADDTCQYVA